MNATPREGYVNGGVNLNLGSNIHPRTGYVNVDCEPYQGVDVITNLEERWPWEDESVDSILAEDIFEHLEDPFHSMNEAWRVLKMGGILNLWIPSTDGRGAFQDPTHISYWNPNTMFYFSIHHPDYHLIYPHLVKCSYEIQIGESPPSPLKVIWFRAICKKVPHAEQVVRD